MLSRRWRHQKAIGPAEDIDPGYENKIGAVGGHNTVRAKGEGSRLVHKA